MKKYILQDLAKELGCSKTLISLVINGKGNKYGISEKTQKAVLNAIEKFNYSPLKYARALSLKRTNFIGLIVSDMKNPFYMEVIKHIETYLMARNYNLMVLCSDEKEEKEQHLVEAVINKKSVDGLIITSSQKNSAFYDRVKNMDMPLVFIDRVVPLHHANYIVSDNYEGSLEIMERLVERGCKKIVCFSPSALNISTIQDRVNGFNNAVFKHKLKRKDNVIKHIELTSVDESIERHLREFIETGREVDAVFALNNHIALSLLKILKREEFSKLASVQLASFEDLEMFNFIDRKITSVAQPIERMAKNAADLVLDLIVGKQVEVNNVILPTMLIER